MLNLRKTKVICTLGPAVDSEELIRKLIRGGMDAARFNFSHGSHPEHLQRLQLLKTVRDSMSRPVATILDTKGPEIRIRSFETKSVTLEAGAPFTLTTREVPGDQTQVSVTYPRLHEELTPGQEVLIDDGLVAIRVEEIRGQDIRCVVENGGTLSANKSINIPGVHIHLPALTEKDVEDIRFGVENDFDYIAASFVRQASDVEAVRAVLHRFGGDSVKIIAKIENQEGVDNLDEILEAADGIMVARGDLGVEIPAARVPILQKQMIRKGLQLGKPVITATQMLDSMMRNPRPTRAEVSDVANAVFDGTSCVMLSGETAGGKYPVEALSAMASIVTEAEQSIDYWRQFRKQRKQTVARHRDTQRGRIHLALHRQRGQTVRIDDRLAQVEKGSRRLRRPGNSGNGDHRGGVRHKVLSLTFELNRSANTHQTRSSTPSRLENADSTSPTR